MAAAELQESDLVSVDLTVWPRVQMLLANANGRIIFGRGPEKANQALKRHEIAMNEMAGKVLSARPQILGWEGAMPKVGEVSRSAEVCSTVKATCTPRAAHAAAN